MTGASPSRSGARPQSYRRGFAPLFIVGSMLYPLKILRLLREYRWLVTGLVATLALGTVVLELGAFTREEQIRGPFVQDGDNKMLLAPVGRGQPFSGILGARGDQAQAPTQSVLKLFVNDQEYATPHSNHDLLRAGQVGRFSHWYNTVRFALAAEVANDPTTRLRIAYPVQLSSAWLSLLLLAALMLLWVGVELPWLTRARVSRLLRAPALGMLALAWVAAAATVAFGMASAWAWLSGWDLPTTAAILDSSLGRKLALAEPHFMEAIFALTALGAVAGWIAARLRLEFIARDEATASCFLSRFGLPIAFAGLVGHMAARG
jgi:hypothetical protein